jgi:hypothetical protein
MLCGSAAGRLHAENVEIAARIGVSFATICLETVSRSVVSGTYF